MRSGQELLRKIINDHSSLTRFGDGEFALIKMQARPWFQKPDRGLSIRLWQVLHSSNDFINVGLANMFGSLSLYKEHEADVKRSYICAARKDIYELIDFSKVYYDANVTRPYIEYKEPNNAVVMFSLWKELFKSRKILIVEGSRARNGINNDLFENASIVRRGDAWNRYEEIYRNIIEKCDKDWLICISLGPTATVLSYDLAIAGYQAIDMGQLDNEYDWFIRGVSKREDIFGKQVYEVNYEVLIDPIKSDLFDGQILFDCSGE